ncbi:MAG TPA: hypothetical protein VHF51_03425 [Solirubrobacteraceae bacterium]|jgi:hypothetical protein|nr:hypothetical protein [Solirubrobacteraceae bacterium]
MTTDTARTSGSGLMHAGAGTGLFLIQLSAIAPGLLATVALVAVLLAVIALPLLALGLVVAIVAAPPYVVWRLVRAARRP